MININKRKEWVEKWSHHNPKHKTYNDGIMDYGNLKIERVNGKAIGRIFVRLDTFPFRIMKMREVDKDFAYTRDMVVDLKIAVPSNDLISADNPVVIRGNRYNIINVDRDPVKNEVFLMLRLSERTGD